MRPRRETVAVDGSGAKELWESLDAVHASLPEHEREPYRELIATLAYGGVDAMEIAQRWLAQHRPRRVRGASRMSRHETRDQES